MELLDLKQRRVVQGVEELEGLINSLSGVVVLSNEKFVLFVLLSSYQGSFSQDLPILTLIGLKLGDSGLQLASPGDKEVLQDII